MEKLILKTKGGLDQINNVSTGVDLGFAPEAKPRNQRSGKEVG